MRRWLRISLALCAVVFTFTLVAGCGGGGGGGGSDSPAATNSSVSGPSGRVGISYTQTTGLQAAGQQPGSNLYETPEPATLSMLLFGITGAGSYLLCKRRRR